MNPQVHYFGGTATGTVARRGGMAFERGPLRDYLPSARNARRNLSGTSWSEVGGVVSLSLTMVAFLFVRTPQRVDGDSLPTPPTVAAASFAAVTERVTAKEVGGSIRTPEVEPAPAAITRDSKERLTGEKALQESVRLLTTGVAEFEKHPSYTAKFFKQERIGDTLHEGEEIDLKLAHEPFQVYMKWRTGLKGQQLIYSENDFDGKLLVQPGGVAGRLCGVLRFEPDGEEAMAQSRYEITSVGLTGLARKIIDQHSSDLQNKASMTCEIQPNVPFEGRTCHRFVGEYASPEANPVYRTTEVMYDAELNLPIWVRNTGWIDGEASETDSLIELYSYTEIKPAKEVRASDFDPGNRRYAMRMKDNKKDVAVSQRDTEDTTE